MTPARVGTRRALRAIPKGATIIGPQPGPQTRFLATKADICVMGGQAGGGKSIGLVLNPLRHIDKPGYNAVFLRRTTPQIMNPGGLMDQTKRFYPQVGGHLHRTWPAFWSWAKSGATVRLAHLLRDDNVEDYQGSAIVALLWDELTHFSAHQFWYLLSRNRNPGGVPVRPYVRATCNPDPDSFVAKLVEWWINGDGYPIYERSGILRYFMRVEDELHWGDRPDDLVQRFGRTLGTNNVLRMARSFTFIPSRLADNRILEAEDPEYRAKLEALTLVERERLLGGNWHIKMGGGLVFKREWFKLRELPPKDRILHMRMVRAWDKAATDGAGDWTTGVLMAEVRLREAPDMRYYWVLDVIREQLSSGDREAMIQRTAQLDGYQVEVAQEQEPGSSGVDAAALTANALSGWSVTSRRSTGSKVDRAQPLSASANHGFVSVLPRPWASGYLERLNAFPGKSVPDDEVDASTLAFKELTLPREWTESEEPV